MDGMDMDAMAGQRKTKSEDPDHLTMSRILVDSMEGQQSRFCQGDNSGSIQPHVPICNTEQIKTEPGIQMTTEPGMQITTEPGIHIKAEPVEQLVIEPVMEWDSMLGSKGTTTKLNNQNDLAFVEGRVMTEERPIPVAMFKSRQRSENTTELDVDCGDNTGTAVRHCNSVVQEPSHSEEKPYRCSLCQYRTARRRNLTIHERTHTDEKYQCSQCQYSTANRSNLVVHERSHTGDKPFKCPFCEYRALRKGDIKIHERRHTGEKPYKCMFCEYATVKKYHLTRHGRTHTGEKPYKCSFCEYRAVRTGDLRKHERRRHKRYK